MKQLLLICAAVALVGCGEREYTNTRDLKPNTPAPEPLTKEESARHAKVIEAAIREAAGKSTGEPTKADLEKVTKLYLHINKLTDVKGLEKLTNLSDLDLHSNNLTDVPKELEKFTKLTWLRFSYNQLTDVTGLEKLTQLKELSLIGNQLTEVPKGLEKLTKLKNLALDNNQLTDVQGLEKLSQLETLELLNNPNLTKPQIEDLQKALPNCKIFHNAKK